jgi:hypothetical protein
MSARVVIPVVCCVVAAGVALMPMMCGPSQKQINRSRLLRLGLMYHGYQSINSRRGPSNPEELLALGGGAVIGGDGTVQDDPSDKAVCDAVKAGALVFIWDVDIAEVGKTPGGTAGTILGYEKDAPISGGLVLMVDAKVKTMTAAEFQAAPLAKPRGKKAAESVPAGGP